MATSATATFDPTADELVTDALRLLQVVNVEQDPEAAQLAFGRRMLQHIMKSIGNEGVSVRVLERVTVLAPAATITAASDTEDVTKMFWTDVGGVDHIMEKRARDEYDDLSLKTTSSPPTQFFVDQANGTFVVYLFPVPDANVVSVTYTRRRRLRDIDTGAVTFDLPQKWHFAILNKLCATLAPHFGMAAKRADYLDQYQYEKNLANGADTETGPARFVVGEGLDYDA